MKVKEIKGNSIDILLTSDEIVDYGSYVGTWKLVDENYVDIPDLSGSTIATNDGIIVHINPHVTELTNEYVFLIVTIWSSDMEFLKELKPIQVALQEKLSTIGGVGALFPTYLLGSVQEKEIDYTILQSDGLVFGTTTDPMSELTFTLPDLASTVLYKSFLINHTRNSQGSIHVTGTNFDEYIAPGQGIVILKRTNTWEIIGRV